ncbi:zinc-binding dehydrogenase [Deinococcus cellulosilyticus]|nr:zinc-binding dehydrogenase [Deinococcus cellulosilyticus]
MVALTAWEGLFECLEVQEQDRGKTLLVIGGAGGVGSMVIQLAKHAGLRVIATASRDVSHDWALDMGADLVVHPGELLRQIPHSSVDFIFNAVDVGLYWQQMVTLIRPRGKIVAVRHTAEKVPLGDLFNKRVSFHWEMVFIRPDTQAGDLSEVGKILKQVAELVDHKVLKSVLGLHLGPSTLQNLREAHRVLRSAQTVGKEVLAGWK